MIKSLHSPVSNRAIFALLLSLLLVSGCSSSSPSAAVPTAASSVPFEGELLGAVIDPPRVLSDFTVASTEGEPFTLSEHQGELILMYFGYRACPDFCPTTFAELRRIYVELGEPAERVKVVFVTVDPERDTMEDLTAYTNAFHQDFIGLRTEGRDLQNLMNQFGVVAQRRQLGDSALSYLVDHTVSVFLIAPDGRLLVQYLYGTDYRDILHDVNLFLQET